MTDTHTRDNPQRHDHRTRPIANRPGPSAASATSSTASRTPGRCPSRNRLGLHGPRRCRPALALGRRHLQRMLTVTLRRLQRDGLIDRTVLDTSPPQVEYSLTEVGHSLTNILKELVDWAETNRGDIDTARRTWDQTTTER